MSRSRAYYIWPVGIIGFLLFIMLLNTSFLIYSLKIDREVVERNPYEAGNEYQKIVEDLKRDDFSLDLECSTELIKVRLKSKSGIEPKGARVVASLTRPSDSSLDRQLELLEIAPGIYETRGKFKPGLWLVRIMVEAGGIRQRRHENVVIN